MRPSLDTWMMDFAEVAATRGTCLRARVGCAVASGNRLLVVGFAGAPSGQPHCLDVGCEIGPGGGCVRTKGHHAEANAIAWARSIDVAIRGATLYSTLSPCIDCAVAIWWAGIARVVYRDAYRKLDGVQWLLERGVPVERLQTVPVDSGTPD